MRASLFTVFMFIAAGVCDHAVAQPSQRGSFSLAEIQPLLLQQPALWQHLQASLDIADAGDAPRIGYGDNPTLAGELVAPYILRAKPKGAAGDYTLVLEVQAETTFLDAQSKQTDLKQGLDLREHLTGVVLRQAELRDTH